MVITSGFVAGILSTLFVELAIFFVTTIYLIIKSNKENRDDMG